MQYLLSKRNAIAFSLKTTILSWKYL